MTLWGLQGGWFLTVYPLYVSVVSMLLLWSVMLFWALGISWLLVVPLFCLLFCFVYIKRHRNIYYGGNDVNLYELAKNGVGSGFCYINWA